MSDAPKKLWYQDGWIVFWIVVIAIVVFLNLREEPKPVPIRVIGGVREPLFGPSRFELSVWHEFPGNLQSGILTVWVQGAAVPADKEFEAHSFETWNPNKDNAVRFEFPLESYDSSKPLSVKCSVEAENARRATTNHVWLNGGWKQ
jgi:hypothetical protein